MKYIPLNIKTEYDLMNSLIKIDELISYAKENNINALGITDKNMFSSYEFINKCKDNNIKPILGVEININESNILIYARNYDGYISLCKIVTKRNLDTLDFEFIKQFNNDLIIVVDYQDYSKFKDFTYLFIKYKNDTELQNARLLTENVVYIDEIRYFNSNDKEYFKYIKYIDENKTIDEEIEIEDTYFKNITDTNYIESTYKFSNLINIELKKSEYHIPVYNDNSLAYLKALSKKGLEKR